MSPWLANAFLKTLCFGVHWGALFAVRTSEASKRLRSGDVKLSSTQLIVLAALLLACIVLSIALPRLYAAYQRARQRSPRALFLELCKVHQLNRESIRLLDDLAAYRKLSHPAIVFVDASQFTTSRLPNSLASRATELNSLRDKLFAAAQ